MNIVSSCSCKEDSHCVPLKLGIVSIPMQPWEQPYDLAEGLEHGTIFPCLDLPFYVIDKETPSLAGPAKKRTGLTGRAKLLNEIDEISFVVNDLTLYLDTHPVEEQALDAFHDASMKRKQLLQSYADQYEPLTMDCVCPDTNNSTKSNTKYGNQRHFTWGDGPLPWEGGTNHVEL